MQNPEDRKPHFSASAARIQAEQTRALAAAMADLSASLAALAVAIHELRQQQRAATQQFLIVTSGGFGAWIA